MNKPSRRKEYAEQTRDALLKAARKSFIQKGFKATSLDEVALSERLTKGALYHHFKTKKALFEAVFDQQLTQATQQIMLALGSEEDPMLRVETALDTFIDIAQQEDYQHLVLKEGPLALGWQHWREKEQASSISLIKYLLSELKQADLIKTDAIDLAASALMGALIELAFSINDSQDKTTTAIEAKKLLLNIIKDL